MYEIQIATKFLWNDGIHILETSKSILGQNFVNKVSKFFFAKAILFKRILTFRRPCDRFWLSIGKQIYFDYFEQL